NIYFLISYKLEPILFRIGFLRLKSIVKPEAVDCNCPTGVVGPCEAKFLIYRGCDGNASFYIGSEHDILKNIGLDSSQLY
ncbi:MAG: hypothetical protein R3299_09390, partial [Arenibacter sp.]|nr:hypothetical protein [Arenibacter sp.]